MSGVEVGLASVAAIVILVYAGMHVPVALALVSFVGVWVVKGDFGLGTQLLSLAAVNTVSSYIFGVVPLFVLMGLLISEADIGADAFRVANHSLRRVPAGLGVATVAANAAFAAITGISIASAAIFSRVAVPEMLRCGYRPRFAVGVVAGSSVLGMLIPPSLLLIVYGVLAEQSVGDLFLAAVFPGLLLTLVFCAVIFGLAWMAPNYVGGHSASTSAASPADRLSLAEATILMAPIIILIVLVIGGIYGGVFTATEAGAIGALGALVAAAAKRKLDWERMWKIFVETGHITASICVLVIAASMYSRMLGLSGVPTELGRFVTDSGFSYTTLILVFILISLLLGTILDAISNMLITVPLFLPLLQSFNADLIWFGVLTVIVVEIGLLTPPVGITAFVVKSAVNDESISLEDVFIGAAPFALSMLVVIIALILFPSISGILL